MFIILGVALSGYLYLSIRIHSTYRVPKFQGYHLLYKALTVGLIFFLLSIAIYKITWPFFSHWSFFVDIARAGFPNITQEQFNLYAVLLNSILFAMITSKILNYLTFLAYNHIENSKFQLIQSDEKGLSSEVKKTKNENNTYYNRCSR